MAPWTLGRHGLLSAARTHLSPCPPLPLGASSEWGGQGATQPRCVACDKQQTMSPGASPSGPRLRASARKHIRMPGSGCPSFRLHGLQTANRAGSGALSVARGVAWWLRDQRGPRSPVPGQGAPCFPDARSRPLPPASWRHEVTFPPACWLLWRPSGLTILTRLSFLAPLSCCPCDAGESLPLLCLCPLALPKESHLSWASLQGCEAAALWLEFLPSSSEYTFS